MALKTANTREELKELLKDTKSSDIGFVPTMGALHEGHLSLIKQARKENKLVVVSIFVNPTQFNDATDLTNYPRTPQKDIEALESLKVDIVFQPTVNEIYPEPDTRVFDFGKLDKVMEGATRPGHFNGVAQVVSRLFDLVKPNKAYFGQKDFQQVAIINNMVEQLDFDITIVTCPIVREEDGLAMSSRNTLLDTVHREVAPKIYAYMQEGVELVEKSLTEQSSEEKLTPRDVEKIIIDRVNSVKELKVIYFKIVNGRTLQDAQQWNEPEGVQGCIAVQAGNVRLIDNIRFV